MALEFAEKLKPNKEKEPRLKRSTGPFQATMYGVGLILGAGIYVLVGNAAGIAGNAVWVSFLIAATVSAFTGMSYAELSSVFPKSAAEYVFVKNAMQSNFVSFLVGSLVILSALAGAAAVAIGFSDYMVTFLPNVDKTLIAVVLVLALSAVNIIGIRESLFLNTIFTLIEISGLALVIVAALLFGNAHSSSYYLETPVLTGSPVVAILSASGLIFFAFLGFENLANISEETKNPQRTIPIALLASILITTAIYIAVAISAISLVGWQALSSSEAPMALAAGKVFGESGGAVLSGIALFATSNTVLMMLISSSRVMYGMSRAGSLPESLSKVRISTQTPWAAIALACGCASALVLVSRGYIQVIASVAVFDTFLVYVLVNLSLIFLRYRNTRLERPFRQPISIGRFPLLAGLGVVTSAVMLFQFDRLIPMFGLLSVGGAALCFIILKRR